MVLIKGKKAQEYLVEVGLAIFLLGMVIMIVFVFTIFGLLYSFSAGAVVDDYSASAVCDTYLLNFLRYEDAETGLTFAELVTLAERNSEYRGKFSAKATEFFNNNYKRGTFVREEWGMDLINIERLSIISIGELTALEPLDTCSQNIPSQTPGKFMTLKLSLDY